MTHTNAGWWRAARAYLALYGILLAMAIVARPTPATPNGWKAGMILAAIAGCMLGLLAARGQSRGIVAAFLETAGVAGIVVFETFHAIVVMGYAAQGLEPLGLSWGRATAHAAIALAVALAARRRPVIRKTRGRVA